MTKIDQNRIPVILGVDSADGKTIVPIQADATTHSMVAEDNTGGTDRGQGDNDKRDDNRKVAFMAVSEVDGVTPVAVYADSATGALLINSS